MDATAAIGQARTYDLEERTAAFGEEIISLCASVPRTNITAHILGQLLRSGTSIGANYAEANGASSKRDFRSKIMIVKRECQETKHWLRLLAKAIPALTERCRKLWKECHELTLIFGAIAASTSKRPTQSPNTNTK